MLVGGTIGTLWSLTVVWLPGQGPQPFIPLNLALVYAFVPAGIFTALLIGWIALQRFNSPDLRDGSNPVAGSSTEVDQRVLRNTMEQALLALLLWPFIAMTLGAVTVIAFGLSFGLTRCAYWAGYRWYPPLRMFGFAAGFFPTILGVIWSLVRLIT